MTNNIEKLYDLANIICKDLEFCESCIYLKNNQCISKKEFIEECLPFTESKQLALIKLLAFEKRFSLKYINAKWSFYNDEWGVSSTIKYEPFEQALAGLVCVLWKDLTDEQREEVRGILQ